MATPDPAGSPWRQLRRAHSMTQQEVADALARLAWTHERRSVGVNADMVSKWERGEKRPSPLYRRLLRLLFDQPAATLAPPRLAPGDAYTSSDPRTAPAVLTVFKDATLLPALHELWKEELVKRRSLLKLMGVLPLVGSGGLVDPLMAATTTPRPVLADEPTVGHLQTLADTFQGLYHTAEPTELTLPVLALVRTTSRLLTERLDPGLRLQVVSVHGQAALLAGRLAFFDLHDRDAARTQFASVLDAARELDDHALAAAALGHMAFIPAGERNLGAALEYVSRTHAHAERTACPLVVSWGGAVESELLTRAGRPGAAMKALERATAASEQETARPPEWFDFYDRGRLEGFRGYTLLQGGRADQARLALEVALTHLPRPAAKQRAVVLTDAATAHLGLDDLAHACRLAGAAADELRQAGYATGTDRLKSFRHDVQRWSRHRAVRELDDRLAGI